MGPLERVRRARFVAQGVAAAGLAVVVSTAVAAAAQAVALALEAGGLAWDVAGYALPAIVLLAVLHAQARLARSQAEGREYVAFAGGAALVLAGFPALLAYVVASGADVDGASVAALLGVPVLAVGILRRAAGPSPALPGTLSPGGEGS